MIVSLHREIPIPDRLIAFLVLLLGSIACFVPWHPTFPLNALDSSWQYALNEAVARHLHFGSEVVFTFGPYASICWPQFHPHTYPLMMFGSAYLALAFAVGATFLIREHAVLGALLLALLLALGMNRDAFQFALPLLMVFVHADFFAQHRGGADLPTPSVGPRPWIALPTCALLVSAVALLPLAKGSLALSSTLLVAIAAYTAGTERRVYGVGVLLCYGVSMCLFWLLAGQQIADLPQYLLSLRTVVAGYTDAMSVVGKSRSIVSFLLAGVVYAGLFAWLLLRPYGLSIGLALLLALAWTFFVVFKSAFVRHDAHEWIAIDFLILTGAVFSLFVVGRRQLAMIAVWSLVFFMSGKGGNPGALAYRLTDSYRYHWNGAREAILNPQALRDRFDGALQRIRQDNPLVSPSGATDIYSYDQAVLLAHGFDWAPRPILQSYAVYTPEAARLNAAHLIGAQAPQTVFFRLQTIDNRLPALDDAYSWRLFLERYEAMTLAGNYAELRRRAEPLVSSMDIVVAGEPHAFGEDVALPPYRGGPLWAELDVHPTLLGRLVSLVFKLPQLHIAIRRDDDVVADYRYIASMGRAGFVLQPFIADTQAFFALSRHADAGTPLAGHGLRSINVRGDAGSDWLWSASYTLTLSELRFAAGNNEHSTEAPAAIGTAATPHDER